MSYLLEHTESGRFGSNQQEHYQEHLTESLDSTSENPHTYEKAIHKEEQDT
ncbi:4281_t:CDS:2 [Dentiscutata erythropus]|uniref:4281_t:CDS:1 n=1 Tax=Dentiscutata erythropus TaxID=1348616 RepID=A0A9N9AFX9_9GLOM|nr:4281_t:CDS:2 [Dentiscutata erythropus]